MFIQYYSFDWLFLFTNAMWIIGGAFILTVVSYAEFIISRRIFRRREIYSARSIKSWLFIGFILVFSGYALSPNESIIAKEAFRFIDLKTYNINTISAKQISTEEVFRYQDIDTFFNIETEGKERSPTNDGIITMPCNGFLGTPFIAFEEGKYVLEFEATGSEAAGEYPKILVYVVTLENSRLSLRELLADQSLTAQWSTFRFVFQANRYQIGKCRIQFYNHVTDENGGYRYVFINKIKISKIARNEKKSGLPPSIL
jgi:hypothetical protein